MNFLLATLVSYSLACRPGEVETYDLDLDGVLPAARNWRMTDSSGASVAFSMDEKVDQVVPAGVYRRPPDGFYSKAVAPASQNAFRRPSYVTFRAPAGVTRCVFSFETDGPAEVPQSDLSLRPWWISILSPHLAFVEENRTVLRNGDFTDGFFRTAGRRLMACLRLEAETSECAKIHFGIRLPNDIARPPNAMNFYFQPRDGMTDYFGEGRVRRGALPPLTSALGDCSPIPGRKGGFRVRSFALQSPPGHVIRCTFAKSDIWMADDVVQFTVPQVTDESLFAFVANGHVCARVYKPRGPLSVISRLVTADGREVASGKGDFSIRGVTPGVYRLKTVLMDGPTFVVRQDLPVRVVSMGMVREGQ